MYEVKLENDFLKEENLTLHRLSILCDSSLFLQEKTIDQYLLQVSIQSERIENLEAMYELETDKYAIASDEVLKLKKHRNILLTSTTTAVIMVVVLALL